jgi:MFS family permease
VLSRVAASYAVLGLSALAWLLAHTLALGILLVGLTGFLEGPAYSGTIAIRQRRAPPLVRAQVMTTLSSLAMVAVAAGAAIGGAIHRTLPLILVFTAVNAAAALSARSGG